MGEVEPKVRTRILVREVMNSPVISTGPNSSLKKVADLMANFKVGSIIIMQNDKPVGMVTDRDIVWKAVAKSSEPGRIRAKEIMSKPLKTIDGCRDITEAARLMRNLGVKRFGVTYKDQLVGVVSVSDLAAVTPELYDIVSEKRNIMIGEPRKHSGYIAGYCDICNQWSDYIVDSDGRFLCDECTAGATKDVS